MTDTRSSSETAEADFDESPYDDERFNRGVQHVVDLLAKTIGAPNTWHSGDGSEDYDEDLAETLRNILEARGLFDKDTGEYTRTLAITGQGEARWYLASMNDGLFIINAPPRPSNDDVWPDRPDGPSIVLNVTELPKEKATKIVDTLNALASSPTQIEGNAREALEPFVHALAGVPASVSDAAPFARVSNDARAPGTISIIRFGEFRKLIAALSPQAQAGAVAQTSAETPFCVKCGSAYDCSKPYDDAAQRQPEPRWEYQDASLSRDGVNVFRYAPFTEEQNRLIAELVRDANTTVSSTDREAGK